MRILLVEDSRTSVRMVEGLLAEEEEQRQFQYSLSIAGTLHEAKTVLGRQMFDLILLDITLPDSIGLDTVDEIVAAAPFTAIVVLTASSDEELGLAALKKGAQDFLVKDETYRKVLIRSIRYAFHRNKAEQEVQDAKAMAEFATNSKSSFIANLSHELRTPLNAIIGFSDMMLSGVYGELEEKYAEYARDINQSGRYVLGLIGTVLDMSKIEAQKIELHEEQVELGALIGEAVTDLRLGKGGSLTRVTLDRVDQLPRIRGDRTKLRQIFGNLLSNAVKYSPEGGEVRVSGAQAPDGRLIIEVSDQGIGIPGDQIAEALKPFGRTSVSRSRNIEGTGLGLPLTKGLVEAHGGALRLESTLGVGTTVIIQLPPDRVIKESYEI